MTAGAILGAHEEIHAAIARHDAAAAGKRMREHIEAYSRDAQRTFPEILDQTITWDRLPADRSRTPDGVGSPAMPAESPTILATSGGLRRGSWTDVEFSALALHALELSGVTGRAPRLCCVGTAGGDQRWFQGWLSAAGQAQGITVTHLSLFSMPSTGDMTGLLLEQDAVWVGGGSVANLLALWRLHGLDHSFRQAWDAGVVLGGVSAGSICWHVGGTTDSFGPELRPVTNGLAFLPFSNGVHYDSEAQRRPLYQRLIADGTLPDGYATDDGTGLLYRGTQMTEALSEIKGKGTYLVTRDGEAAREERIEPRLLPGAG